MDTPKSLALRRTVGVSGGVVKTASGVARQSAWVNRNLQPVRWLFRILMVTANWICGHNPDGWLAAHAFVDKPAVQQNASAAGSWCLALTDAGRGWSIVAAGAHSVQIWNPGPGRYPFTDLQFTGKENRADQMRSNASGIGIRAAARVGGRWTALQTFRDQSGPGQNRQPIPVGLGDRRAIDFVSLLWPDGLFQTELGLAANQQHRIEETQRQVSSCPVLFVWDGTQHRFVSDVLGVGGLGFNHGRGVYHQPRPWENLMLPADLPVATEEGTYRLKIGEPMEEACYLDAIRLVVYDLPSGWRMTMDERQSVGAPTATGEPIYYRRTLTPITAVNERGEDTAARLAAADGVPALTGTRDRRFLARTSEFSVALKFDRDITGLNGRPVLVIDGWVEYPYSQTMFAAWQAGASYDTPKLEARAAGGAWQVVYPEFGYPAGMPRQMSLPLDPQLLPAGATEVRITTNLEVYWDRIFLAVEEDCADVKKMELSMQSARVQEVGFPQRTDSEYRRPSFDYGQRTPLWIRVTSRASTRTSATPQPLVTNVDDAVAIIGPGEEVEFEFDATAPPAEEGRSRQFVLECHGCVRTWTCIRNTARVCCLCRGRKTRLWTKPSERGCSNNTTRDFARGDKVARLSEARAFRVFSSIPRARAVEGSLAFAAERTLALCTLLNCDRHLRSYFSARGSEAARRPVLRVGSPATFCCVDCCQYVDSMHAFSGTRRQWRKSVCLTAVPPIAVLPDDCEQPNQPIPAPRFLGRLLWGRPTGVRTGPRPDVV